VAGLVYCFRVFALEAMLPADQRAAQGPDDFEAFLEQRKQYLTDGLMSIMRTMISLMAYGSYLTMDHGNAGAIFWEKEDKVMKLHGMRIVMDKVNSMVDSGYGCRRSSVGSAALDGGRQQVRDGHQRSGRRHKISETRVVLRYQPTKSTHVELRGEDRHVDARVAPGEEDETTRRLLAHPSGEGVSS
jgi:hypothetical protein